MKNTNLEKRIESLELDIHKRSSQRKLHTETDNETEKDANANDINLEKLEERILNAMEYKRKQERPYVFVLSALLVSVFYALLYAIYINKYKNKE